LEIDWVIERSVGERGRRSDEVKLIHAALLVCGGGGWLICFCVVWCVQAYLTALRLRKGTDVLELFHFYDPQKGRQIEM
jgi:hypothetical protein